MRRILEKVRDRISETRTRKRAEDFWRQELDMRQMERPVKMGPCNDCVHWPKNCALEFGYGPMNEHDGCDDFEFDEYETGVIP